MNAEKNVESHGMFQNKTSPKICVIRRKQTEACEALKHADFADERRENVESHGMFQNKTSPKICGICGKQTEACEALKPADFANERRENVESHGMLQNKLREDLRHPRETNRSLRSTKARKSR
ncbi:hypothetical protein ESY86_00050 [Subsaximicrobium wynnwilliamsii]|uniref:Uncharacterized protein n=1 Tax=Subsaximicrobium wynnwilliamsii TaxID=291179 RepID=A0A5C6ZL02_9FLAO|nr:hypothetical protein [Subsaximicrobium wynnwilliamsii]TXD81645.1 hypothetical protein ESY87_17420 [Subsaximicrobium wynnwilliamsii]TXD91028.1 hypothetical protein ESY86_00050 [Subsaximicrobium wynnwilliamsii]TXE01093.1 hypothetical protein ESY88_17415 [Subsaximicrobium wynnwilliamsii]